MLDRYIIIDVEQMMMDYDDNRTSLEALREQLEELSAKDIGGMDYSRERVQTSEITDSMGVNLIRKNDLEMKIGEYETFFKVYDPAWESLNDDEKFVLMAFCAHQRKQSAADRVCEHYGIEIAEAYRRRNKAVNRFRRLMFG